MIFIKTIFFTLLIGSAVVQFTQERVVGRVELGERKPLEVQFLGEYILPPKPQFDGTTIGGLSSIDYYDNEYYLVCDDEKSPRFYTMTCEISDAGISNVHFIKVTFLNEKEDVYDKILDHEALRFDYVSGHFFWASEGKIKKYVAPAIFECDVEGRTIRTLTLPSWENSKKGWGPRHNEAIENLTLSKNGEYIWVAQESPLKQDGKKPSHTDDILYPIRFSKIDKNNFGLRAEYVYPLDAVARPSVKKGGTAMNGLAEIMYFDEQSFLTIERSYVSGYDDGGNDVKIYQTYIGDATDVSDMKSLKESYYQPMKKELVVDFNEIKHSFPNGFVDNIEGICFGPTLPNGHRTILVVSDDNFGKYGPQANQFIVFELIS